MIVNGEILKVGLIVFMMVVIINVKVNILLELIGKNKDENDELVFHN